MEKSGRWEKEKGQDDISISTLNVHNAGSGVSKKKQKQFETLKLKPQVLERSTITNDLQTVKKEEVCPINSSNKWIILAQ